MMELNRDEIIKALECCKSLLISACKECPYRLGDYAYDDGCVNNLVADALALINELTEENEKLKASKYMAYPDGRIEAIPKRGWWKKKFIYAYNWDDFYDLTCSECGAHIGETSVKASDHKYCFNCGAKMDGAKEMMEEKK